jgi:hypothetical protein
VKSSLPLPFPQECSLFQLLGPWPDAEQAAWKFSRRAPREGGWAQGAQGVSSTEAVSPLQTHSHTMCYEKDAAEVLTARAQSQCESKGPRVFLALSGNSETSFYTAPAPESG